MEKLKYYVTDGYGGNRDISWLTNNFKRVRNIKYADVFLLTGGSDISPNIYGDAKHHTTSTWPKRDSDELINLTRALKLKIPVIGICRGHQLLSAVNGTKLFQHVDMHAGRWHRIKIVDKNSKEYDNIYEVNSLHHQMVNPLNLDPSEYELIAVSFVNYAHYHLNGNDQDVETPFETEIIYFPKTQCYGMQFHPEMMGDNEPILDFLREDIKNKLKLNINVEAKSKAEEKNEEQIFKEYYEH